MHDRECRRLGDSIATTLMLVAVVGVLRLGWLLEWSSDHPRSSGPTRRRRGGPTAGGPGARLGSAFSVKRLDIWVEPRSCQSYVKLTLTISLTLTLRPLT